MIIRKCDKCGCNIEKGDKHYSINEVEYHGTDTEAYLHMFQRESDKSKIKNEESWVSYEDWHWCKKCFEEGINITEAVFKKRGN